MTLLCESRVVGGHMPQGRWLSVLKRRIQRRVPDRLGARVAPLV